MKPMYVSDSQIIYLSCLLSFVFASQNTETWEVWSFGGSFLPGWCQWKRCGLLPLLPHSIVPLGAGPVGVAPISRHVSESLWMSSGGG